MLTRSHTSATKCSRMWPSIGVSCSICFPRWVRHRRWPTTAPAVGTPEAEPLLQVVLGLSRASAQLAAYLEPREHGAASPVSHIREAIEDLHASAEALATVFAVDLARAPGTPRSAPGCPAARVARRGRGSSLWVRDGWWCLRCAEAHGTLCHVGCCASPCALPSSSATALASCRSAVSNPSVNQP